MDPREQDLPVPRAASPADCMAAAAACVASDRAAVLATVLARRGSAPATPGQKLLLDALGTCLGTIGGGALERAVVHEMRVMLDALERRSRGDGAQGDACTPSRAGALRGDAHAPVHAPVDVRTSGARSTTRGETAAGHDLSQPRRLEFSLAASLGMCCGGGVEVLLEPFAPPHRVLLVGAGHVCAALVPVLATLGFWVGVCDEREAFADAARFPLARRVVCGTARDGAQGLPRSAAVLTMTHDHALDQSVLEWALTEGFALVGGVGSRAKAARTRARLETRGFSLADRTRVRMPFGVDVGARSPEEISVAIAAELIAWRRGVELLPLRATPDAARQHRAHEASDRPARADDGPDAALASRVLSTAPR